MTPAERLITIAALNLLIEKDEKAVFPLTPIQLATAMELRERLIKYQTFMPAENVAV